MVPGVGHFVSTARTDLVDHRVLAFLRAETRQAAATNTETQEPIRQPGQGGTRGRRPSTTG
jgi:hypothetical protein